MVEQRSSIEQCGGTLQQWKSIVEQRNSVIKQCEECGTLCWTSETV